MARSVAQAALERVEEWLRETRPRGPAGFEVESHAAVAMLLRIDAEELEVLLLQRAEREGDRWSGQISLPGGREEEGDASLLATALRETREETALDLEQDADLLGRFSAIPARARGREIAMAITPFVFRQRAPAPVELNEEAVAWFWFPLRRAASGELTSSFSKRYDGETFELPCWDYEGYRVWGLTFQMVHALLRVAFPGEPAK